MGRVAQATFQLTHPLHVESPHETRIFLILAIADPPVIGAEVQILAGSDLHADRAVQARPAAVARIGAVAARGPVAGQIQTLLLASAFQQQHLRRRVAQTIQNAFKAVKRRIGNGKEQGLVHIKP